MKFSSFSQPNWNRPTNKDPTSPLKWIERRENDINKNHSPWLFFSFKCGIEGCAERWGSFIKVVFLCFFFSRWMRDSVIQVYVLPSFRPSAYFFFHSITQTWIFSPIFNLYNGFWQWSFCHPPSCLIVSRRSKNEIISKNETIRIQVNSSSLWLISSPPHLCLPEHSFALLQFKNSLSISSGSELCRGSYLKIES